MLTVYNMTAIVNMFLLEWTRCWQFAKKIKTIFYILVNKNTSTSNIISPVLLSDNLLNLLF